MYRSKWLTLVIGTLLVSSGLIPSPASAGNPAAGNQSDITGTNVWNNTAPIFDNDGQLNEDIRNNARRLAQELDEAAEGCCNAPPSTSARRFARNPGVSNQACASPGCVKLNEVMQETEIFLDEVNRSLAEQANANRNRAW
ncbi:MAG TPA: hypothetical protein DDZ80_11815 [Cyanobacteria bacterium UBA8803]|nr:hypothetical protein [Cyanobacteria bacterium UBA9273]HBL59170.1 hypothetical protein [Cyanobacteria bacterium UBA8803]